MLFALFTGVLVTKTVVFVELRRHPLLAPDAGLDTTAYAQLAARVLGGDFWLGPGVYYVSPFYIYFLAAGLAVFHTFDAVRYAQVVLGTISVGFVFVTAREWFGHRAALFAAILAALTGLFAFYESLILQAAIDPFLTSAGLCALALGLNRRDVRWVGLAGLVFGLQTLNRPNVLLAVLAVAVVLLLGKRRDLTLVLALVAGVCVGMSPALARNVAVAHQWTFVSSHGGLNFYIGNSDTATGFYHAIPGITPTIGGQEVDARNVAERAAGRPLNDSEVSAYFYGLSRAWIAAHPAAAAALFARKLVYVFNAAHVALPHSYPFYAYEERTFLRFLFVGPWLLIPLGLVGLLLPLTRERNPEYIAWAAFVPAYAAAVAAFFVAERYRLPLLVPLTIGAGFALDRIERLVRDRGFRGAAFAAVSLSTAFILANWPLHLDDGRWQEGLRLAQRLVILGRYDEADAWTRRMEPREPRAGATEYGVGAQLALEKQYGRAVPHLQQALARGYSDPMADYLLGDALLESGRAADAVPYLKRAFDSSADLPAGGLAYPKALQSAGESAEALAALHSARLPANDPDAWTMAGRIAVDAGRPADAEPFFARAAVIAPQDAAVRQQHGLNLLVLDRIPEAAQELAQAARLDPRDPDTLSRLAYCELKLGRARDAKAHASAALALDPGDRLAREILRALPF